VAVEEVKKFMEGNRPHFSNFVGLKIVSISPEKVEAMLQAVLLHSLRKRNWSSRLARTANAPGSS